MSKRKPDQPTSQELLDQIGRLQEQVRQLQAGATQAAPAAPSGQPGQPDGLAEGILAALGKMVPGLGSLIQTAAGTAEFRQRLAAIDQQVKSKFKEQPLRRAAFGIATGLGPRQMGIPPAVRRPTSSPRRPGMGRATSAGGQPSGPSPARGTYRQPGPPKVHITPETPAQLPVDVFDEGGKIVVLAEAAGLQPGDITVSLDGTVLLISVEAAHRKSIQRVELPCHVAGEPEVALVNGILKIQVRKREKQ